MENNRFNKAKFASRYFLQDVFYITDLHPANNLTGGLLDAIAKEQIGGYLKLKSLNLISDDDAIAVGKLRGDAIDSELLRGMATVRHLIDCDPVYWNNIDNLSSVLEYLCLRGYALPWLGVSVEKQVEYGWVKLIDNG